MITIPVLFEEFSVFIRGWIIGLTGETQWTDFAVNAAIWVFVIGSLLVLTAMILGAIKKIRELWKEVIIPKRYDLEERRRQFRRHMFADHIESEIRYMNSLESWNDNRFAELEAHVEAEGSQKLFDFFSLGVFTRSGIRLVKSLSGAIEKSDERLILLEGDPGSGKSVALRHVTQLMAAKARKSRNLNTRIPIYVNLKYLRRSENELIDRNLIEKFIFRMLNRVNDRDVDEYLHDEFERGIEDGTWFFLFDSFDEIPEILSSTGTDDAIRTYAEAIRDFLHGMNNCKGIVASREYKGPRFLGWPKFHILSLDSSRRIDLVKRTGLPLNIQRSIINGLAIASDEFRAMTSNPMFLNLICDYMNKQNITEFPSHIHVVFREYVLRRLTRDEERVKQRFNKSPQEVQNAAEKIAFCMTADQGVGLSPTLDQLQKSTEKLALGLGGDFGILTEALAYLKLARMDTSFMDGTKTFTFSHRRFQEYFATAVVLREPERLSSLDLITNGRWRETAVVILQTQKNERVTALIDISEEIIDLISKEFGNEFLNLELDDLDKKARPQMPIYHVGSLLKSVFESFEVSQQRIREYLQIFINAYEYLPTHGLRKEIKPLVWPKDLYHVISILQDGLSSQVSEMPNRLQNLIDKVLIFISQKGDLIDKKLCLELLGVSSESIKVRLLTAGIRNRNRYVSRVAFRRVAALGTIPEIVSRFITRTLLELAIERKLFTNRHEIYAQLSRLEKPGHYLNLAKLFSWASFIDLLFILSGSMVVGSVFVPSYGLLVLMLFLVIWYLTWFSENLLTSLMSRSMSWIVIIFLPFIFALTNSTVGLSHIISSWIDLNPNNVAAWYLVFATGWGASLIFRAAQGKIKPQPYHWPFYSLLPTLVLLFIVFILRMINNFDWLGNYIFILWYLFGGMALVSLLNLLYIVPRIRLIYRELLFDYRNFKFLSFWYEEQIPFPFQLLYFLLGFGLVLILVQQILWKFLNYIVMGIVALSFVGGFYFIIRFLIPALYKNIISMYGYFSWRRNPGKMKFIEFLAELNKHDEKFIKDWMLRYSIKKQILTPSVEDEVHIRNLISYVSAVSENSYLVNFSKSKTVKDIAKENYQKMKDDLKNLDPSLHSLLLNEQDLDLNDLCELLELFKSSQSN